MHFGRNPGYISADIGAVTQEMVADYPVCFATWDEHKINTIFCANVARI
jgi:hypothetical protein